MSQFGALRLTSQQSQIDPHRSVSEIIMTVRSSANADIHWCPAKEELLRANLVQSGRLLGLHEKAGVVPGL